MRLDHVTPDDVAKAESANLEWLEAAAVHLLCVLALDRFADYVSDQARSNPALPRVQISLLLWCLLQAGRVLAQPLHMFAVLYCCGVRFRPGAFQPSHCTCSQYCIAVVSGSHQAFFLFQP